MTFSISRARPIALWRARCAQQGARTSNRRASALRRPGLWAPVGFLFACGSPSVAVPTGPHHPEVEVPAVPVATPPPPAKIEIVPLKRNEDCLFLDGHYEPVGGSWRWQRGEWVLPEQDCYYAPPTTSYDKVEGGTTLAYRAGVWLKRGDRGKKCKPAPSCPAPHAKLEEK